MRGAFIAAVSTGLAGTALGQHTFSSGETDYGRHVELLLDTDLPDPELLKAQALSELAGELWLAAAASLNALDTCGSNVGTDALAAAQCVNERAVSVLAPEVLATEIEQYCSYMANLNKRPESVAGCFIQSWRKISGRALGLRQTVEQFTACSFPDLIRVRELHLERTKIHLEQIISLDALVGEIAAGNRALAYYDTLNVEYASDKFTRAISSVKDALERARKFNETLAEDRPPAEISTLLAISTAQQNFSWCHNRHPRRAKEWEEIFAAYAEGSPASIPTWLNFVPTVEKATPIDVRGAARRTFEAMVRAHDAPSFLMKDAGDGDQLLRPQTDHPAEELLLQCDEINRERYLAVKEHSIHQARLATMTGSIWAGCGDEFFFGAVDGLGQDLSSGVPFEVARYAAKRSKRPLLAALFRHSGYADLSGAAVNAAAKGVVASSVCRSQNERALTDPQGPGLDDDGKPISSLPVWLSGNPTPGSATITEMNRLIGDAQARINAAEGSYKLECIAKLQELER